MRERERERGREREGGRESKTLQLFLGSKYNSIKHKKYFSVYDNLFSKYINKKIIFVEIGILNGSSIKMWKDFFVNGHIYAFDIENKKHFSDKSKEVYNNYLSPYGTCNLLLNLIRNDGYRQEIEVFSSNICSKFSKATSCLSM